MKNTIVPTNTVPGTSTVKGLRNIRIASPCPADWATMVGDERIRHCSECNLNVYNLSAMTERQVQQLIAGNQGQRMCLRLYRRADGTILTQDCPWSMRALKRRVSRIAGAVLSAVLSVGVAAAKTRPQQNSQPATQSPRGESGLVVTVVDSQGAVVSGAQITLSRTNAKKVCEMVARDSTDSGGRFHIPALPEGEYTLTVTANYFKTVTRTIKLEARRELSLDLQLKIDPNSSTTVEVGGADIVPLIHPTDAQVTNVVEGRRLELAPVPMGVVAGPPRPLRP